MNIQERLSQSIQALPDHLVKEALLKWVETSDGSLAALSSVLEEQTPSKDWLAKIRSELQVGIEQADRGEFSTRSFDDIEATVLKKYEHQAL